MSTLQKYIIPPQQGSAFRVTQGQSVRIIDIEGKQFADFMAINSQDNTEIFSSGVTMDCNASIYLKTGDYLYSNKYNKLLEITEDKVGKHDLIHPTCSGKMYETQYNIKGNHPSCHENIRMSFEKFGILYNILQTPFNIFMNTTIDNAGIIKINPPLSKPGDYIVLKACCNLVISVAACSVKESACNDFLCKSIGVEIYNNL
jgi:uncharacterized protein YcgI (DUF1989 family)